MPGPTLLHRRHALGTGPFTARRRAIHRTEVKCKDITCAPCHKTPRHLVLNDSRLQKSSGTDSEWVSIISAVSSRQAGGRWPWLKLQNFRARVRRVGRLLDEVPKDAGAGRPMCDHHARNSVWSTQPFVDGEAYGKQQEQASATPAGFPGNSVWSWILMFPAVSETSHSTTDPLLL
jgi:hypothetical protein